MIKKINIPGAGVQSIRPAGLAGSTWSQVSLEGAGGRAVGAAGAASAEATETAVIGAVLPQAL